MGDEAVIVFTSMPEKLRQEAAYYIKEFADYFNEEPKRKAMEEKREQEKIEARNAIRKLKRQRIQDLREKGITLQTLVEKRGLAENNETWKDVRWTTLTKKQLEKRYLHDDDIDEPFYVWTDNYVYGLSEEYYIVSMPRKLSLEKPRRIS